MFPLGEEAAQVLADAVDVAAVAALGDFDVRLQPAGQQLAVVGAEGRAAVARVAGVDEEDGAVIAAVSERAAKGLVRCDLGIVLVPASARVVAALRLNRRFECDTQRNADDDDAAGQVIRQIDAFTCFSSTHGEECGASRRNTFLLVALHRFWEGKSLIVIIVVSKTTSACSSVVAIISSRIFIRRRVGFNQQFLSGMNDSGTSDEFVQFLEETIRRAEDEGAVGDAVDERGDGAGKRGHESWIAPALARTARVLAVDEVVDDDGAALGRGVDDVRTAEEVLADERLQRIQMLRRVHEMARVGEIDADEILARAGVAGAADVVRIFCEKNLTFIVIAIVTAFVIIVVVVFEKQIDGGIIRHDGRIWF